MQVGFVIKNQKRQSRQLAEYSDISNLKGVHQGRKCFVCAAGPSIGFLDLSDIHEHVVIAINSSILLMDWDKGEKDRRYWISNDSLCLYWNFFWRNVLRSKCQKLVRTSWKPHDEKIRGHGFRYFAPRKRERLLLSSQDGRLCSNSSLPTGIDLATLLASPGANIFLLGADHKMVSGKSHFWQFWPKEKWPQRKDKGRNYCPEQSHQIRKFQTNKHSYIALKEYANRLGSKIYNCSTRTTISDSIFPRISLERALEL
ncbi:hypothetical protein LCGC14_0870810 [marine sediment metagenome]|uniref:DUF115 domain-containing protein n=1 Tax=marine sediment metagenome TaxID=412755 RepID=A0A0F9PQD1_9ZZZZ